MKIEVNLGSSGQIERKTDFEGAKFPNGKSIEEILKENDDLTEEINRLKLEIKNGSSILNKMISNRLLRIVVEIILLIGTLIGIVQLF